MTHISVNSSSAPKPFPFFSHAILSNCKYRLEVSGQIGLNPKTGVLVEGVSAQTEQTLTNIKSILSEVGWNFANITKVRIFLASMNDYKIMNDVYASHFVKSPPARLCVAVKELPLGALVEIECYAEGDSVKKFS